MPKRHTNGYKVKQLREQRGLTQTAIAQRARISSGWLREIEQGRTQPSNVVLHRIANALGVAVEEISDEKAPATAQDDTPVRVGAAA